MNYVQNTYIKGVSIGTSQVRYMYYLGKWRPYNASLWNSYMNRLRNPRARPYRRGHYMYLHGRWVRYNAGRWNRWVKLNTAPQYTYQTQVVTQVVYQ